MTLPESRPETQRAYSGSEFLPQVLTDDIFGRVGVRFGVQRLAGRRVNWAVVDPNRHSMFVWQKRRTSYVRAARDLNATVVTSGPFTNYPAGRLSRAAAHFAAGLPIEPLRGHRQSDSSVIVRHFQALHPLGHVVGRREGIDETSVSRPRAFHIGRSGMSFNDYVIGRGDPPGLTEAVGGLFPAVVDYAAVCPSYTNLIGFWGLAPLTGDEVLRRAGVDRAREIYENRTGQECDGVLVVMTGLANTRRLAELMAGARVKQAVQIDGADSLLLGHGSTLVQGKIMSPWKRVLQRWGLQFQPRSAADGRSR